jgi:hypothetical protein
MSGDSVHWVVDGGHEWLAVPLSDCVGLGVSEFSYVDRSAGVVYLEGDLDACLWFGELSGVVDAARMFPIVDHGARSWVRDLPRFDASVLS